MAADEVLLHPETVAIISVTAWIFLLRRFVPRTTLLSEIALWKRFLAKGDKTRTETLTPPADDPKTVTESGFPPKFAMLSWTQRSAASWSK